jgi:hypothetical protein
MANAAQLLIEAPFRPTDWRWEKARIMREDPRLATLLRHQDDDWTRRARKFQEDFEGASDDYEQILLARRWPALWAAHCLRFQEDEKRLLRYEIEARLLANEPFERIAERTGLSPDTVIWYEKIFFSVIDKLKNRGWVAHCVMGESAQAGMTERDYDLLWKMMGYMGGGLILDAVIDKSFDVARPENSGQIGQFLNDDIERISTIKMAVAMRTMPVNTYTQEKIAEIFQRFRELKKMADGPGGTGDMLTSNILAMIGCIGWTVGHDKVMVAADDPKRIVGRLREEVLEADNCAVELRASELMQLNTGQRPVRLAEQSEARFPERKNGNPQ